MEIVGMAGHLVRRLHQISTQLFVTRAQAAGFDITPVQFAAMDALRAHPGLDQASVAALIACDRATIGGVIDRLVAKGLVARSTSVRDRRAREVQLTAAGETVYEALLPEVHRAQAEILADLTLPEREHLRLLLGKAIKAASSHVGIDGAGPPDALQRADT